MLIVTPAPAQSTDPTDPPRQPAKRVRARTPTPAVPRSWRPPARCSPPRATPSPGSPRSPAASVSKGLLYHYFPEGRPQLFVSVMQGLLGEFQQRLRQASKMPFSPRTRMEHLLAALFGFFDENPSAYRLLFRDPWVTHDDAVEASAIATRVQIASELATLMAGPACRPTTWSPPARACWARAGQCRALHRRSGRRRDGMAGHL